MIIVYSDRHKLHATDQVQLEEHPLDSYEVPARAEAILAALWSARLGSVAAPVDHGLAPILAVHDAGFVDYLQTVYSKSAEYFQEAGPVMVWTFANRHTFRKPKGFLGLKGYYAFGWGTPILEGTWEAAYWSAQCALTAADLVCGGTRVVYALCRPPGHHAGADLYGGYCYLNNAAIAARYLQFVSPRSLRGPRGDPPRRAQGTPAAGSARQRESSCRVAILDVDYHHGNGTQMIFYTDPSVFYGSLHVHPDEDYPYYWGGAEESGEGEGKGSNHNWPLSRGTGDARYLETLDEALAAICEFAPAYLVVSLGLDIVEGDPEGGFHVTAPWLREIGERIAHLGLPTVIVQEGGYGLDRLGEHALVFLEPFARTEEGAA
jgi:acetoin utilization deacetylase AcuC-like enzyme